MTRPVVTGAASPSLIATLLPVPHVASMMYTIVQSVRLQRTRGAVRGQSANPPASPVANRPPPLHGKERAMAGEQAATDRRSRRTRRLVADALLALIGYTAPRT